MSKHHIVEYSCEEKSTGEKKTRWVVNGYWAVVIVLALLYLCFGADDTIGNLIKHMLSLR